MKDKRRFIPVLVLAVVLTAFCTAAISRWYLLRRKGDTYNSILLGKVVSNDGRKLVFQGNITNPKGQNGQYVITYSPGIPVYDSRKNEISFSDLKPVDRISVYRQWSIPKYGLPRTNMDDYSALEENQEIPEVMAIALIGDNETAKGLEFFEQDFVPSSDENTASAETITDVKTQTLKTTIPQLLVTSGLDKTEIPSSSGGFHLYTPDGQGTQSAVVACGAEPLSYLAEKAADIPYVKLGTDISLEFREGTVPDDITVQDLILRSDGSPKYNEQATEEFTLACSGSTACFSLEMNRAALLSSDMSSQEEAGILRGFRINCRWNNNSTAEYGFIIRTDASSARQL